MFEPTAGPRVFGTPPGVDFAEDLVAGLLARHETTAPEQFARCQIYVNTTRMQRRIRSVFDQGKARLLPQIKLITDLANDPLVSFPKATVSTLRRRLQVSELVARLLEQEPDLAPKSALYELSDSLLTLMDEMHGEGVNPAVLASLDVSDQSGHWDRALKFLNIITPFFAQLDEEPNSEARQRRTIETLAEHWKIAPPNDPILVAGSTGSRGATAMFMHAVAHLPNGAIILPGYDEALPNDVWDKLGNPMSGQDHPQYRFKKLMSDIGFTPNDVQRWSNMKPHNGLRNKLVSLSLRPAPVTNQWLAEGPDFDDLIQTTKDLTLVEADAPRLEAETIALRLRQAAADGITAALISPDRMLTRQVTAALDRWDIRPDDSAGTPLVLSAPGRLLRHTAALFGNKLTGEMLLTILKHPLCFSENEDRGPHLILTRELELYFRKIGAPFPTKDLLQDWAKNDDARTDWITWIIDILTGHDVVTSANLTKFVTDHLSLTEKLCAGPDKEGSGGLWLKNAGREAQRVCDMLVSDADAGGTLTYREYGALFSTVLADGTVRNPDEGHPQILILGTLEARVQGFDLTILGGMNDGTWPESNPPDPWLNRKMRADAGLLLPERRIGLSAHDYQQAIAGKSVWITRSKRSADTETVPSRWVNRLTNLLAGLPGQGGAEALEQMRARGDAWLAKAAHLSTPSKPTPSAARPSPQPPTAARPKQLSVTQIKTLIRDPYVIYAREVLRLRPLDPLAPTANAPLRGIIIHSILEQFINGGYDPLDRDAFMQLAQEQFDAHCPWPTIRAQWMAGLDRSVDRFLQDEIERQSLATKQLTELKGEITVPPVGIKLVCKADRIDLTLDGDALIYDYKTGQVPSGKQQEVFDKQLLLEAAMVENGAFAAIGQKPVSAALFIAMNTAMKNSAAPLNKTPVAKVWEDIGTLFAHWQTPTRGYTARLAMFSKDDRGDYDHLSRFGEWDTSDDPTPTVLT